MLLRATSLRLSRLCQSDRCCDGIGLPLGSGGSGGSGSVTRISNVDGMSAESENADYDFDAAISFAGEDRQIVREMAEALKNQGVRTFFDEDFVVPMWGEDLVEYFNAMYGKRARFMLMFVSRHYAEKAWPKLEMRAGLARALDQDETYILPIRLDDADFPSGLPWTRGFLDARRMGVDGVARAFVEKLTGIAVWDGKTPRSHEAIKRLLALRPPAWEYLLWAGHLYIETQSLQGRFLDHEAGYSKPSGERVSENDVLERLKAALADVQRILVRAQPLWGAEIKERAFGRPGEPGSAERIEHLARRMAALCEDLLEWSDSLRSLSTSTEYGHTVWLLSRLADQPIKEYREFVAQVVEKVDLIPELLARPQPEPVVLEATLTLTMDQEAVDSYLAEVQRAFGVPS